MANIKFFSGDNIPLELHKVRMVQKLNLQPVERRAQAIAEASGGSGKRLWPLSNNSRSKQFIKLLNSPDGQKESMVQRVIKIFLCRKNKNAAYPDKGISGLLI